MLRTLTSVLLVWCGLFSGYAGLDDLEDINFPLNSSVVVDGFQGLDLLAAVMVRHSNLDLEVIGHTDSLGTPSYNDKLSIRRAEAVKTYLVSKGAGESTIKVNGEGISSTFSNATREGRFQNRRVSLHLYETVDGNRQEVSYRRLIELFFGNANLPGMMTAGSEPHKEVLQKLSDLEKQMSALESRLNDAFKNMETAQAAQTDTHKRSAIVGGHIPFSGYSGVSFGVGDDEEGGFTASVEGLYFRQIGENFAIQSQAEFNYYNDDWDEGQADMAFIYQQGSVKLAAAGSYKWASLPGLDTARVGQGAFLADFNFDNGKIGVFGTIPFADGDVLAETPSAISSAFVIEQYVSVPRQFGLNFGVNLGQRAKLGGYFSSIDAEGDSDTGAGLDLDIMIKDYLGWYLDVQMNRSLLYPDDNIRYTTGLKLGSWNQARYGRTDEITPVDIPNIRLEILSREVRRGNNPPVADAGPSRTNVPAGNVTLDGSNSSDPEGDTITFKWVQTNGPTVTLSSANSATTSFTGVAGEAYTFELRVTDSFGESGSDIVRITMEAAAIPEPTITSFVASPSTIDEGQFSNLAWSTQNADTVMISGIGQVGPNGDILVAPDETTTYTLTATNVSGSVSANVTVTVNVIVEPPIPDPEISFFSATPETIIEGEFTTLNWSTKYADTVTISGLGEVGASGSLILSPDETTTYTLTATNESGTVDDSVTVTVEPLPAVNHAPIANAGRDQILNAINSPQTVTLDGSGSYDPDMGDSITYAWVQVSGPPVALTGADTPNPSFTALFGDYSFKLVVTDQQGLSDSDEVRVFVANFKK